MRIAHIYKAAYPPTFGGIEQYIALLAELQAARGDEVQVIAAGARGHSEVEIHDGYRIVRLPERGQIASSPVTCAFAPALRRLRADVAHFHHPNPVAEVSEPLIPKRVGRVLTYHADITRQRVLGRAYRPLLRRVLRRMNAIIVASEPLLRSSPLLEGLRSHAHVIPYAIRPPPSSGTVTRQPRTLLFVGRLREYKGLPVLLRALAKVPDAELRVIGQGPLLSELAALARSLGIERRVSFLHHVSEEALDQEYRAARLLVLPSTRRSEAFGIVLAEALARGTPCVSTDLGTATSWVNLHSETGLVVPPGDVYALAAAIRGLIGDDELWSRLALGALHRAKLFSPEEMVERVDAVYRSSGTRET